ncbi:sirohydrochlorin chelatase [Celeribacter neptunius]|uniref:Sirohydrochlorin ferrochelatase n=1 Tax=Celeribacter neptunius TaxID=588602 RepID=A0A1I3R845_9RHOB|nr:hypothetical protein [Celeribacter neptunius]SFJ41406.1 hypothetical protein SAMN04487991_2083 [Celeribacter neptunius]
MTAQSVLIVTHGSPSDPEPQEMAVNALARQVAQKRPDLTVAGATLAAPGQFEARVAQLGRPQIFPFFMSDGHFIQHILAKRAAPFDLRILPPFGVSPELPGLVATRLSRVLAAKGWRSAETGLLIAAHGGQTSARNATTTRDLMQRVGAQIEFREIRVGFVEEPPFLNDVAKEMGQAICLTFFAQRAGHVLEDLSAAFKCSGFSGLILPPFIEWPETPDMIATILDAHPGESDRL